MTPRTPAARALAVLAVLGCTWALRPNAGHAEAPGCVDLILPQALGSRDSWHSLLQQELKPIADGPGASCAQIAVLLAPSTRQASALQISWDTQLRTIPLVLGDLPAAQRPRAAALLARGMLQQLVHASDAAERERAAAKLATRDVPAPSGRPAQPEAGNAGVDAPAKAAPSAPLAAQRARADEVDPAREAAREPPAARNSAVTTPSARPAAPASTPAPRPQRLDAPELDARHQRQWTGVALAGSTLLLNQLLPLIHFELAVQRRIDALRARVALGLTGAVIRTRSLDLGGPGVRVGIEFALVRSQLSRVWLGPGGNLSELVLARDDDSGATKRSFHTVASVDLRLNLELLISRKALLLLALECAYVLRYLDVRKDQNRLLAYAGMLVGLRVGAGF
jgi:hypothetical protein